MARDAEERKRREEEARFMEEQQRLRDEAQRAEEEEEAQRRAKAEQEENQRLQRQVSGWESSRSSRSCHPGLLLVLVLFMGWIPGGKEGILLLKCKVVRSPIIHPGAGQGGAAAPPHRWESASLSLRKQNQNHEGTFHPFSRCNAVSSSSWTHSCSTVDILGRLQVSGILLSEKTASDIRAQIKRHQENICQMKLHTLMRYLNKIYESSFTPPYRSELLTSHTAAKTYRSTSCCWLCQELKISPTERKW